MRRRHEGSYLIAAVFIIGSCITIGTVSAVTLVGIWAGR